MLSLNEQVGRPGSNGDPEPHPVVLDTSAVGRLYLTTVQFASFEENSGSSNSTTPRLEANGALAVIRPDAIRVIATGSG